MSTPHRTIRVPDELWHAAQTRARGYNLTMTDVLTGYLRLYVRGSEGWIPAVTRRQLEQAAAAWANTSFQLGALRADPARYAAARDADTDAMNAFHALLDAAPVLGGKSE